MNPRPLILAAGATAALWCAGCNRPGADAPPGSSAAPPVVDSGADRNVRLAKLTEEIQSLRRLVRVTEEGVAAGLAAARANQQNGNTSRANDLLAEVARDREQLQQYRAQLQAKIDELTRLGGTVPPEEPRPSHNVSFPPGYQPPDWFKPTLPGGGTRSNDIAYPGNVPLLPPGSGANILSNSGTPTTTNPK